MAVGAVGTGAGVAAGGGVVSNSDTLGGSVDDDPGFSVATACGGWPVAGDGGAAGVPGVEARAAGRATGVGRDDSGDGAVPLDATVDGLIAVEAVFVCDEGSAFRARGEEAFA